MTIREVRYPKLVCPCERKETLDMTVELEPNSYRPDAKYTIIEFCPVCEQEQVSFKIQGKPIPKTIVWREDD